MAPAPNRDLFLPYALPYLLYVGVAAVPVDVLGRASNYALRLVVCSAALAWGWRRLAMLRGPGSPLTSVAVGALTGVAGTGLWIAALAPLAPAGGDPWPDSAVALRVLAAVALVPLIEELLMRGYLLRLGVQWDRARRSGDPDALGTALDRSSVNEIEPGAWTVPAIALATLLFAAGHTVAEWPAALLYGLLMAALWIVRKDLLSCVVAHAVTNLALACVVRFTGWWALW